MRTAKAQRISPVHTIPATPTITSAADLPGTVVDPQGPKSLAERDAAEFMNATYVPCAPKVAPPDQAAGAVAAKAGSPRPPGRRAPTSGSKAKEKKAKAKADKATKGKGGKGGQAGRRITVSDEVVVTVDRRTPKAAIPVLEREAAAMNATHKNAKKGGKPGRSLKPDKAPKRLSCLDAAAQVLSASKEPMKAAEMIAAMAKKGLWSSPKGKTPEASLNAAIIREISGKGKESRFVKTGRGLFAATSAKGTP